MLKHTLHHSLTSHNSHPSHTPTTMAEVARVRDRDNCNSRHFSRLIKSCCPNPHTHHHPSVISPINKTLKYSSTLLTVTAIGCLPDDILYEILSRVSLFSLLSISAVCRKWACVIDCPTFTVLRRNRLLVESRICAFSPFDGTMSFAMLRVADDSWRLLRNSNVSLTCGDVSHARVSAIGRKVFMICRFSCLVFDPWTGLVKCRSGPLFPRKRFAVAAVDEKLYVAGGTVRTSALEEYNPIVDEWRVVSDAPRKRYGCVGVGVEGVFYVIGGLKIGDTSDTRATMSGAEARVYASSMDLFDVTARVWLRSRVVPGGGCVVAACGASGHVYVLVSHAVELSFWRFNGRRKSCSSFGEWCRMKSPPLPALVRLDGTVKFNCVGGEEKVVLIQVMGCIDDLLRRSGRNGRGYKQGLVLVFDCVTQEWSRAPDLPESLQRAACVSIQC